MRVTRMSGLPIEPEDIPKYKDDLEKGLEILHTELGRFENLEQKGKDEFIKRFEAMRDEAQKKYKFEDNWNFDEDVKSMSKLKVLLNKYGIIAFGRTAKGRKIHCFICDK